MEHLLKGIVLFQVLFIFFKTETVDSATIVTPLSNSSGLIGSTLSFYCGIEGQQEAWEVMQWIKQNPTPHIIAADNSTGDESKYGISMRYNLTVKNVQVEDDDIYSCRMGVQEYEAKLTVSVTPSHVSLTKHQSGSDVNLTCTSYDSRPKATFTWLQGEVDVTHESLGPYGDLNQTLFGDSWSTLPVYMTSSDAILYTCVVHLPGVEAFARKEIIVTSSATSVRCSCFSTIATLLAATSVWLNFK